MMRQGLWVALAMGIAACQEPAAKLSLADAEALCTQRAKQYSQRPLLIPDENGVIQTGLQAELPDSFMIRDFYKSCYFANTGQRAQSVPKIPAFG